MDDLVPALDQEVIMQIGDTKYEPKHSLYFSYLNVAEANRRFSTADVVISHCSTGSVLNSRVMRQGRPTIVVPRLKKHKEHLDDHQSELADLIEQETVNPFLTVVRQIEDLESAVRTAGQLAHTASQVIKKESPLLRFLSEYVQTLSREKR
jgi:UDP-N-acetylglucosamine transferase subunit ALG13